MAALDTYVSQYVDSLCHCEFSSVCCTTFYQHVTGIYHVLCTCPLFIQTILVQKLHSHSWEPIAFTLQVYYYAVELGICVHFYRGAKYIFHIYASRFVLV